MRGAIQLPLVLDGHLTSHAIGALEQIEAETQRQFLLRGTRSVLGSMLAQHALIVQMRILVRQGTNLTRSTLVLADVRLCAPHRRPRRHADRLPDHIFNRRPLVSAAPLTPPPSSRARAP